MCAQVNTAKKARKADVLRRMPWINERKHVGSNRRTLTLSVSEVEFHTFTTVSYTHLTLPTICSV